MMRNPLNSVRPVSKARLIACTILAAGISFQSVAATYTVVLGEKFTLKKDESARLKDSGVELKVTGFVYSPCPKNAMCAWSGLDVMAALTIDGKQYPPYETHYNVNLIQSDYKSYATFTITHVDTDCATRGDGCWDELMRRFKDESYCYKMKDPVGKGYCLDNAKKFKKSG